MSMVIKELPSGTIDISLKDNRLNVIQFNCECTDALSYCQAACCRHREKYAAFLESDETQFISALVLTARGRTRVLASKPDGTCVYLTEDNKCSVHNDKPRICKKWHCSPRGKGEGVVIRDKGWGLYSIMEAK